MKQIRFVLAFIFLIAIVPIGIFAPIYFVESRDTEGTILIFLSAFVSFGLFKLFDK